MRRWIAQSRQRLTSGVRYLHQARGAKAKATVLRMVLDRRSGWRQRTHEDPVGVSMKELDGRVLWLRAGTTDLSNAVSYYRERLYLPPPELRETDLKCICELGSNAGAGLAALALTYPSARILGVEPDPDNLRLARRNIAPFGARVEVVLAGVWDRDTELTVDDAGTGEHGLVVRERRASDPREGAIQAFSIDTLLDRRLPNLQVDYMHVTIEGTESRVFEADGEWPARVRSLRVELHPYYGYTAKECIGQLEALGYRARVAASPPDKWVYAVRA